jgi:hypothetical protein
VRTEFFAKNALGKPDGSALRFAVEASAVAQYLVLQNWIFWRFELSAILCFL